MNRIDMMFSFLTIRLVRKDKIVQMLFVLPDCYIVALEKGQSACPSVSVTVSSVYYYVFYILFFVFLYLYILALIYCIKI